MADTLPDILVTEADWVDVYALTGIAVGTALVIQNKSSYDLLAYEAAAKPNANVTDGVQILPFSKCGEFYNISSGVSGLWMTSVSLGDAKVNVQEA